MFAARKVYNSANRRCLMIGDRVPDLQLPVTRPHPELRTSGESLSTLFKDKRSLVIAHPGAFTHHSSSRMLPEYAQKSKELVAAGVSQILVFSVNDKFVIEAYEKKYGFGLDMICDWNGELTQTLDLGLPQEYFFSFIARRAIFLVDESTTILGVRSEETVQYTNQTAPSSALSMIKACFGSPT